MYIFKNVIVICTVFSNPTQSNLTEPNPTENDHSIQLHVVLTQLYLTNHYSTRKQLNFTRPNPTQSDSSFFMRRESINPFVLLAVMNFHRVQLTPRLHLCGVSVSLSVYCQRSMLLIAITIIVPVLWSMCHPYFWTEFLFGSCINIVLFLHAWGCTIDQTFLVFSYIVFCFVVDVLEGESLLTSRNPQLFWY